MRRFDIFKLTDRWQYLSIAILAAGLYASSLSFDFTLDDAIVIYDNEFTKKGLNGIPDILSHDTFRGFFKVDGKDQLVSGGRYRPLTLIIFAGIWEVVGRSPLWFHLANILIYMAACLSLLWIGKRLRPEDQTIGQLFYIAAIIFAVHPVHVEVVANVKGMDEVLCFALGIWAFYFTIKKQHWLAVLLIFLSLMSKEMSITWIPIAIAFLWIVQQKKLTASLLGSWPLFLGGALYISLRLYVLGWPASEPVMEMMNNPFIKVSGSQYVPFTFSEKIATIFHSLFEYIRLLVAPFKLTHDYYPRQIGIMHWTNVTPWLGVFTTLLLFALAFFWRRRSHRTFQAWGLSIYLLGLVLICNIIFPIGTHMGERFIFLSSFGFAVVIADVLRKLSLNRQRLAQTLLLAYITVLSFLTLLRIPVWQSDYILFTTDVQTSDQSAKALNAAGGALVSKCIDSIDECKDPDIDLAISYLKKSISIHPNYKNAHLILGNAYFIKENYEKAIQSYTHSLKIDPTFTQAQKNLVRAYNQAAQESGEKQNDVDQAIILLGKALELDQNNLESLRLLGVSYGVKGQTNEAIKYFSRILEINPNHIEANRNLGISYMHLGNEEKAKTYLSKAQILEKESQK